MSMTKEPCPAPSGNEPRPHRSRSIAQRVVLIVLLVLAGLELGLLLGSRLATAVPGLRKDPGFRNSQLTIRHPVQPDWGGGRLSFPARSAAEIVDSVRTASEGNVQGHDPESNSGFGSCPRIRTYSGQAGGVVLRRNSGTVPLLRFGKQGPSPLPDYALALALPALGQPGRSGLFELPSSNHFQKQLLPGAGDAEAPAPDIPLYPQSSCRIQVGHGTACFTGFYLTPDGVEAVRSFYVRVLSQFGWQRVTADRQGLLETFAKPDEGRTVVVQLREQDSVTTRIGLVATTAGRKK